MKTTAHIMMKMKLRLYIGCSICSALWPFSIYSLKKCWCSLVQFYKTPVFYNWCSLLPSLVYSIFPAPYIIYAHSPFSFSPHLEPHFICMFMTVLVIKMSKNMLFWMEIWLLIWKIWSAWFFYYLNCWILCVIYYSDITSESEIWDRMIMINILYM